MFEQERVIGRLQRRIAADPAIVGCFLGGSFGRRAEDDYSDIDVALIFADDAARDRAWHERNEFARSVMPYVPLKAFDGKHVRPYLYITLFSNGSKIDYRYESAVSLAPNPWDGQIRILKDSDGWAEQFQADSARLSDLPGNSLLHTAPMAGGAAGRRRGTRRADKSLLQPGYCGNGKTAPGAAGRLRGSTIGRHPALSPAADGRPGV
jgi:hypothetical protein